MSSLAGTGGSSLRTREPHAPERAFAVNGHVVPREVHDAAPGEFEVRVAVRVTFAVAARAVEPEAVELDGQLLLRPERVDLVRALLSFNRGIEERARYVWCSSSQQVLEAPFQEALLGARLVGGNRPAERSCPAPTVGSVEDVDDRGEVEDPVALGTVDGSRKVRRFEDSTEIEKGAGDARHRNTVVHGDVLRSEHSSPVHPNARRTLALLGHRDFQV